MLGAVACSHFTNVWFPWLLIAGGQVPCALACKLLLPRRREKEKPAREMRRGRVGPGPGTATNRNDAGVQEPPDTPGYELIRPPFGNGAYGKVWLARNSQGNWQALKAVYRGDFDNARPFEREFEGVRRYQPLSDKHPGLLRVGFVSEKRAGYFYYVMELGDALEAGWANEPERYRPRDLACARAQEPGGRLAPRECVRIGVALSSALEFLHQQGLTHRDIKPQNILFVGAQPKLADVGLISELRPRGQEGTYVGTPGYLPPPPERPGTVQADVYALGMVLYVASTGRAPASFPEIASTLVEETGPRCFLALNDVIVKACDPDCRKRYLSAAALHRDLVALQAEIERTDRERG